MGAVLELLVAIGIPLVGAFAVNAVTPPPGDWYKSLDKPSWTPPNWLFPVMWTTLYILMGTASWLVWRRGGFDAQSTALSLYGLQLALNFCWSPLFFGLKRIDWALVEIVVLWAAIVATIVSFWSVSRTAAGLLLPYICWASVAVSLNLYIYMHNPPGTVQGNAGSLSEPLNRA